MLLRQILHSKKRFQVETNFDHPRMQYLNNSHSRLLLRMPLRHICHFLVFFGNQFIFFWHFMISFFFVFPKLFSKGPFDCFQRNSIVRLYSLAHSFFLIFFFSSKMQICYWMVSKRFFCNWNNDCKQHCNVGWNELEYFGKCHK